VPAILVHGGAGAWQRSPPRLWRGLAACTRAALAGQELLHAGGTALDAVEVAVRALEDDPALNAGRGSHPNDRGVVEMDALIMDGRTLGVGAVAALQRVLHPVSLARRVMTDTTHCLLVAEGASHFADEIGFPRCSNDDLLPADDERPPAPETVGAVALDASGRLACAVSTGGVHEQKAGRVGDSPIAGAGGYADAQAAVAATGDGEAFIRLVASKRVCDLVAAGTSARDACDAVIRELSERFGAHGGFIALSRDGAAAASFTTGAMPWALARDDAALRAHALPGAFNG
jgi:beta-aspartyl-peptidase (threonine type)